MHLIYFYACIVILMFGSAMFGALVERYRTMPDDNEESL